MSRKILTYFIKTETYPYLVLAPYTTGIKTTNQFDSYLCKVMTKERRQAITEVFYLTSNKLVTKFNIGYKKLLIVDWVCISTYILWDRF